MLELDKACEACIAVDTRVMRVIIFLIAAVTAAVQVIPPIDMRPTPTCSAQGIRNGQKPS